MAQGRAGRRLGRPLRWPLLGAFLEYVHGVTCRGAHNRAPAMRRRGTRGRIVSLSLSQRHAASESEAACDRRPAGRPLGGPYDAPHQGEPFANH